ncbi:MAG: hypothetical protein LBL90_05935 [Prevotellaceae bacterium]|nr:hypothetical protein [Prevotellaceae bacterium]
MGKKGAIIEIVSDNPELNGSGANMNLLSERFIVFDTENPARTLDVQAQTEPILHNDEVVGYISWLILQEPKAKVVLVGFKCITVAESVEFETSPLFFTVPLDALYARTLIAGAVYGECAAYKNLERMNFFRVNIPKNLP